MGQDKDDSNHMHGIVTTIQYITASARASPAKQKPLGCILAKFSHGDASWKMHKMLFKVPKSCWARQSEEGRSRWLSTLLAFALDNSLGVRETSPSPKGSAGPVVLPRNGYNTRGATV